MENPLQDVAPDKAFDLKGKRITNLYQLAFELKNVSDEDYDQYVKGNENYISDWIFYVLDLKPLADRVRESRSRKGAIEAVEQTIFELENPKKKQKSFLEKIFSFE